MKRKALIIAGVVVVLLLLVVVALPFLVNLDSFRPAIESRLQTALARRVEIGKLRLSLFAGGIVAQNLSIADDPAFSKGAFLKASSLDVGVDLPALIFSRTLSIRSLTLEEPQVALINTASGRWNFSSLGGKRGSEPGGAAPDFSVEKLRIHKGRIAVGRAGGKQQVYENVNVDADNVSLRSSFPFSVEADTPGGGRLQVKGEAGPVDRNDASATPMKASIKITGMDLASTGFIGPESGLAGVVDLQGKISSDGKLLHSTGEAKVQKLRLVKTGSPATMPVALEYASDYNVARKSGELTRGDVRFGGSAARVSGNFDARGQAVDVHMKLNGQNMPIQDVAGLLPAVGVTLPAGSSLQGGTATANLSLDGPVDRLVTSGTVDVANVKLAGFNLASKMAAIAALAGVHTGADTMIQSMTSRLRIAPEGIRADDLRVVVPELGSVTGSGTIAANNALNFRMLAKLTGGGSLAGGLSQLTTMGQSKGIPFLIQGTTSNPVFVPDIGGMVGGTVQAPVQGVEGLGGVLGGFFGKKKK
jgi:AsmA protein